MKLWISLIKVLFIGALFLVSNYSLHLSVPEERGVFGELFVNWISNLISQGVQTVGYVVNSEWLPGDGNSSSSSLGLVFYNAAN